MAAFSLKHFQCLEIKEGGGGKKKSPCLLTGELSGVHTATRTHTQTHTGKHNFTHKQAITDRKCGVNVNAWEKMFRED